MTLLKPAYVGDCATGLREPVSGQVYDLRAREAAPMGAELTWSFSAVNEAVHEVGVYADGELQARVDGAVEQASLANLTSGQHSLALRPGTVGAAWPERHGDDQGSRAWLTWPRCTDANIIGYKVYQAGTSAAIKTLSEVAIQQLQYQKFASSPGRASVFGAYLGSATVNASAEITITGSGTFSYDVCGSTGTGEFSSGQSASLPLGVWVTFHDDEADYDTDDTLTFWVGPSTSCYTDTLAPATYVFSVKAVTAAGNESAAITTRSVRVMTVPPAAALTLSVYNEDANTLWLEWTTPTAGEWSHLRVYSNYDLATGTYADHIIEDNPTWVYDYDVQEYDAITHALPTGTLRFYARPYSNVTGVERKDIAMYTWAFPATPAQWGVVLGDVTSATATPKAGGAVDVEWFYRFSQGDSVSYFLLEYGATTAYGSSTALAATQITSGFPLAKYKIALPGNYAPWGAFHARITAYAIATDYDVTSSTPALCSCVPEATAPTFTGRLDGVRQ